MNDYRQLSKEYESSYQEYKKIYRQIGYVVLILVALLILGIYQYFKTESIGYIFGSLALLVIYLIVLKFQDHIKWKRDLAKQQLKINEDEISFVTNNLQPYKNGIEFLEPAHSYANDLDIFGKGSLYQHLNRTATFIGEKTLANTLTTLLPNEDILQNQEAIKELSTQVTWRQKSNAIAQLINDSKKTYEEIIQWTTLRQPKLPPVLRIVAYIMPVITWVIFVRFYNTGASFWFNMSTAAFILNNAILATQFKKIKQELISADKIDAILKGYGLLIKEIEDQHFKSPKLIALQEKIKLNNTLASKQIKELSSLFNSLNAILNVFGTFILNGLFLSHIHILNRLLNWKEQHAALLQTWLQTIGEFEALNSLANFCYNNPENCFPQVNKDYKINFSQLGHPLISSSHRKCNDVSFVNQQFMILSGSNMSGKSTFLRAVGVNMVLTGTGAPICATQASIHPLQVYASMRLSDSLTENESYFFAEIKRLQFIKEALDQKRCFVLLDEILRGTNSDDKQNGTIQVIKKMIERNAIGVIATHDLEVCATTIQYPTQLFNKCFEVEIINNDLHFDYVLRNGICKNKSATFLMEKLGVI
jgi:hypothetical protein